MKRPRPRRVLDNKPIIRDIWGDEWGVFEHRKTPYGFPLILGRPYPPPALQGGSGGTRVIMTAPLAAHLRAHERSPYRYPIPVSRAATNRLRSQLGIDHRTWNDGRLEWWMDRVDDLARLSVPEFVARHRKDAWTRKGTLSGVLVWNMRIRFLGRQRRPAGWWKAPAVQKLLSSQLSTSAIAERLHIDPAWVGELRRKSRVLHKRSQGGKRKR